jgi:hypothetical protein
MMVMTKAATYLPRWLVGASSDVAASAVSSLTPAPTPAKTMPQIKTFIVFAVEQMIIPTTMNAAPPIATQRRPTMSEILPVKGHTQACTVVSLVLADLGSNRRTNESKLARMNQIQRSVQMSVHGLRKKKFKCSLPAPPMSA